MEKLQFHFKKLQLAEDEKRSIICVTRITMPSGMTYKIPHDYLKAEYNAELTKTPAFTKVKRGIKQRNQYRNVWINLTNELRNVYCDEENIQFNDEYLEEVSEEQNKSRAANNSETPL
ncbi:hypothetical protein WA026_022711 [Henosepilachna vigintioctopunctata]|uniref:Uncharacterized protein n=1 Tax=Henosepilachna vigintioctopunctata TaxID=420089 RepID=A0AAW1TXP5_9CUCU